MDILEKREHYSNLYDFYEPILTKKQQQYFKDYYFEDLSLAEIAQNYGVSRNAVFDQLQKVHSNLDNYEEKLGLYKKFIQRTNILNEYSNLENNDIQNLVKKLKEIE